MQGQNQKNPRNKREAKTCLIETRCGSLTPAQLVCPPVVSCFTLTDVTSAVNFAFHLKTLPRYIFQTAQGLRELLEKDNVTVILFENLANDPGYQIESLQVRNTYI